MYWQSLPWTDDTVTLFTGLAQQKNALLLDSQGAGRWDILLNRPVAESTLTAKGWHHQHWQASAENLDACAVLAEMANWGQTHYPIQRPDITNDWPFVAGVVGYLAYACPSEKGLPSVRADEWPLATLAYYTQGCLLDHQEKRCWAWCAGDDNAWQQLLQDLGATTTQPNELSLQQSFQALTTKSRYANDIGRIHEYIRAGDCYQVNYTQCWQSPYSGDLWAAYPRLRNLTKAPYAAFWNLAFGQMLCLSPEQFLTVINDRVITKPIKGTKARSANEDADDIAAQSLISSQKDLAENIMITDLLRNDLSKHAVLGSVSVPKLCELESFGQVHHLVTTIEATLHDQASVPDLLRDAFPGGSITGAPKRRVMEIINELEVSPRGVYCGSLFYWDQQGRFDSNITIRTLVGANGQLKTWAGGGITLDSTWQEEYQECQTKMGAIMH
ncbi:MAG: anthranilate synthase component I family protein, partial [Moraxellaceae bacterium]|nr:anthranilate synthase component I family protein [Moraxellaceae bacterium]